MQEHPRLPWPPGVPGTRLTTRKVKSLFDPVTPNREAIDSNRRSLTARIRELSCSTCKDCPETAGERNGGGGDKTWTQGETHAWTFSPQSCPPSTESPDQWERATKAGGAICQHPGPESERRLPWDSLKHRLCPETPKHRIQIRNSGRTLARLPVQGPFRKSLLCAQPGVSCLSPLRPPPLHPSYLNKCPFLSGSGKDNSRISKTIFPFLIHLSPGLLA